MYFATVLNETTQTSPAGKLPGKSQFPQLEEAEIVNEEWRQQRKRVWMIMEVERRSGGRWK